MRKRTITCISKNIFWYLIYLLPWICIFIGFIFYLKSEVAVQQLIDIGYAIDEFFSSYALMIMESFISSDSIIVVSLTEIFGNIGILPIFGVDYSIMGSCIFAYFGYFVGVYLIHLCIDFLLFIPRLAHKWMNSFTSTEDCD